MFLILVSRMIQGGLAGFWIGAGFNWKRGLHMAEVVARSCRPDRSRISWRLFSTEGAS